MKISKLMKMLQKACKERGDAEVTVSVDISTGDADLEARAFGQFIDCFWDGDELVLLAEGETNKPRRNRPIST